MFQKPDSKAQNFIIIKHNENWAEIIKAKLSNKIGELVYLKIVYFDHV